MRNVTVAAIQMSIPETPEKSVEKAEKLVRKAAAEGANVILLPELFENWYFCQERRYDSYKLALPLEENPAVRRFQTVAKELSVVLPISFYEQDGNVLYNSVAMIDADGSVMGVYRKTHIPDDHFYQELLFYPTAIGSEPVLECDSMPHWQRCMQGHAAANLVPVIAANRIGTETVTPDSENQQQSSSLTFYGSSFIADNTGALVECADRTSDTVLLHTFDLDELRDMRLSWGVFRDRRPEMYGRIAGISGLK